MISLPKLYIYGIALLVSFSSGAWSAYEITSAFAENRLTQKLAEQADKINQECEKSKQITEGVDNDYQQKINKLRADVKRARGLRSNAECVPIAKTSIGDNAATTGQVISGKNGASYSELISYAEDAEETRLKLISCQDFIRLERGK